MAHMDWLKLDRDFFGVQLRIDAGVDVDRALSVARAFMKEWSHRRGINNGVAYTWDNAAGEQSYALYVYRTDHNLIVRDMNPVTNGNPVWGGRKRVQEEVKDASGER